MAAEYERIAAEALRKNAYDASAWNKWGEGLLNEALRLPAEAAVPLLRDAEKKFAVATDLTPQVGLYWKNWGIALGRLAERSTGQEAADLCEKACVKFAVAVKYEPRNAAIWHDWAYAHFERAKFATGEQAAQLFDAANVRFAVATDMAPAKVEFWQNWGLTLKAYARILGHTAARQTLYNAAEKFGRATRLAPHRLDCWTNWGSALLEIGKNDEPSSDHWLRQALEKFDEAIARDPNSGIYRYNKAIALGVQAKRAHHKDHYRLLTNIEREYAAAFDLTLPPHFQVPAYFSWAHVLGSLAKQIDDDRAILFFEKAQICYQQIRQIDPENRALPNDHACMLLWQATIMPESETRKMRETARDLFVEAIAHSTNKPLALSNMASLNITQARHCKIEEAESLLNEAEHNCAEAAKLSTTSHGLWINWGSAAHERARLLPACDERDRLVADALGKYAEADRLKPNSTAYSRACIAAISGDPTKCRELMETAFANGALPRPREIDQDADLDSMRSEDWFIDLMRRYRAERNAAIVSVEHPPVREADGTV